MVTDFTGTNTEKVDKVVGAVVEPRTTVRLCLATVGLGLPLIIESAGAVQYAWPMIKKAGHGNPLLS